MTDDSWKLANDRELIEYRKGVVEDLAEYRADLAAIDAEIRQRNLAGAETEVFDLEAAAERLVSFARGEAHTPTDDEREVLARIVRDETGEADEESGFVADAVLAAGFRRSVVPDSPCLVAWGTHACRLPADHTEPCQCCCTCTDHLAESDENGCVGAAPYYGPETTFSNAPVPAQTLAAVRIEPPQGEPSDALTIPRPHVPYGPVGIPEHEADADYLDHAAASLEGHYEVGGSNVRATVVKLLRDTAAALRAASAVTAEPSREALLAQGFSEGVNFIDEQPGPWGAGVVAGRAEAARRRAAAAVTEQGENR